MKKIIVMAFALLLLQTGRAQSFQLGLKAGANISNFSGGDFNAVKKNALVGYHGGLYLNFKFGKLGLQPEIMVSTQGAKIDSGGSLGTHNWKVTYVTVPVMLRYRGLTGFYLEAGPQVGFKISDELGDNTINEFAKNLDLAAAAGLGYQGKKGFGIGARYTAGLSKVGDFSTSAIDPDFKNGVVQLSVYIPLTKR